MRQCVDVEGLIKSMIIFIIFVIIISIHITQKPKKNRVSSTMRAVIFTFKENNAQYAQTRAITISNEQWDAVIISNRIVE